jgi:cellobiose-specific phosphotransferase system component IIB
MLKIAICCGEGFSSGFLSRYLAKATLQEKLQDDVKFIFIPFYQLYERQDEVDIAMIMPHIEPHAKNDKREYHIPMYVIPYKVVIKPKVEDYLEDGLDIMEMSGGKGGIYRFPEEELTQHVSRLESHRKWAAKQEQKKGRKR